MKNSIIQVNVVLKINDHYYSLKTIRQISTTVFYRATPKDNKQPCLILAKAISSKFEKAATLKFKNELKYNKVISENWGIKAKQLILINDAPYLVFDDYYADTLEWLMKGQLELAKFFPIALKLVSTIKHFHQCGLVHQDINPSSFLIDNQDNVYLSNFFLVKSTSEPDSSNKLNNHTSNFAYISPEHSCLTSDKTDQRSDLYSLGVILYELLTGRLPIQLNESASPNDWLHCHQLSQPRPIHTINLNIPITLSKLVSKLLEKQPSSRYKTAGMVESDLLFCSINWHEKADVTAFPLGENYHSNGLTIPDTLFQREYEIEKMHSSLESVRLKQKLILLQVYGLSGIGKSKLLECFMTNISFNGSLIAYTKIESYITNIPYLGLINAFRYAVKKLTTKTKYEYSYWSKKINTSQNLVSNNSKKIFPELSYLNDHNSCGIENVQSLHLLKPHEFEEVIRNLIALFSTAIRPLILIIDDAHNLDKMSIAILNSLLKKNPPQHLLIITSECGHLNMQKGRPLDSIINKTKTTINLNLEALKPCSIKKILVSTFNTKDNELARLSALIHKKTNGCPFFVKSLIKSLFNQGLALFDHTNGTWSFQYEKIKNFSYTDNVAKEIIEKFRCLPSKTQELLEQISMIGRSIDIQLIESLFNYKNLELQEAIKPAINIDILHTTSTGYAFFHTLVHEEIKQNIPYKVKIQLNLKIGRCLLSSAIKLNDTATLFIAFENFIEVPFLITKNHESLYLATQALTTVKKAKKAKATDFAIKVLSFIYKLRVINKRRHRDLLIEVMLEHAECKLILGNLAKANELLNQIFVFNPSLRHKLLTYHLMVELSMRKSKYEEAVLTAIQGLSFANITLKPNPTDTECEYEYKRIKRLFGSTPSKIFSSLPLLNNEEIEATLSLLCSLSAPASFTSSNLHFFYLNTVLEITLAHGVSGPSVAVLGWFGVLIAHRYEHYSLGFELCQLARALALQYKFEEYEGKTLLTLDQVSVWVKPIPFSIECVKAGFSSAICNGDIATACFECCHQVANFLFFGTPLKIVLQEIELGINFTQKANFEDVRLIILVQQSFVSNLMSHKSQSFSGTHFSDIVSEYINDDITDHMSTLVFWFWLYKGISHYLANEIEEASNSLRNAEYYTWSAPAHIHLLDFHFFSILTITASVLTPEEKIKARIRLEKHYSKIKKWAAITPYNFIDKQIITEGEIARFDGDNFKAMSKFESAILCYRDNEFIQYRAIAHELAAKLALNHKQLTNARTHIEQAIYCFTQWGALNKVRNLYNTYSNLNITRVEGEQHSFPLPKDYNSIYQPAIVEACQAITVLNDDDLILQKLLALVVKQTIAITGILISLDNLLPKIHTVIHTSPEGLSIEIRNTESKSSDFPVSIFKACMRTREIISTSNIHESPYEFDSYWSGNLNRSAVCIPIIVHNKPLGAIYLESLAEHEIMDNDYLVEIEILTTKIALVLENKQLRNHFSDSLAKYSEAEHSYSVMRTSLSLSEKISKTGSWHLDIHSNTVTCSTEMCRIYGISPNNNKISLQSFDAFSHPDDSNSIIDIASQAIKNQQTFNIDHRICRSDGCILYLNSQGCPVQSSDDSNCIDYVGTVTDITERRTAEDALRIAQEELARVSRINTVGQLTSSIAHEINQPLMSIVSNAAAGIRWLNRDIPNLEEVMSSMNAISNEGQRAGNIVQNIRNLTRNIKPLFTHVNIITVIEHVLSIIHSEAINKNIKITLQNNAQQLIIHGDSIQLQQVILNIIMNAFEAMAETVMSPRVLTIKVLNKESNSVNIEFKDTGPGIEKEISKHLFEAFFTTKKSGMGMGLAICQSIISMHKGKLVGKANTDIGSTFTITIPLI